MHFVNQHDDVMAKNLAKRLIHHGGISLASQRIPEFALEHRKGALNIAALVLMLQEIFPLELEVVKHLPEKSRRVLRGCVPLESDERRSVVGCNRGHVDRTAISRICRNLRDRKCPCSRVNERRHSGTIARTFLPDFHGGNDVRFDSAHDMRFDPLRLFPHPAVLVVKPARVPGSAETGRVHGEINFHTGKGQLLCLINSRSIGVKPSSSR